MYREKTIGIDRSVKKKKIPKSKGLVGACAMYGGKVSKLISVELIRTYILEFSLEIYMAYIKERREYIFIASDDK